MIGSEGSMGLFGNMRRACSQCGGPIVWVEPEQMDSELVALAKEASEWLGESATAVWRCRSSACAEIGFFGGMHFDMADTGVAPAGRARPRKRTRGRCRR